jgi:hypothetical protein
MKSPFLLATTIVYVEIGTVACSYVQNTNRGPGGAGCSGGQAENRQMF